MEDSSILTLALHGSYRIAFPPQQGNQPAAAHEVAAADGYHARTLGDVLLDDRNPQEVAVIQNLIPVRRC